MTDSTVHVHPLEEALAAADAAATALVALGVPLCPSCELLEASLLDISRRRPGLWVGIATLATADDWAAREHLLWPRGIHVSRASVPVLVALRRGDVLGIRQGGGPASVIDAWLTEVVGPPDVPPAPGITGDEAARLDALATLRGRHLRTRGVHAVD